MSTVIVITIVAVSIICILLFFMLSDRKLTFVQGPDGMKFRVLKDYPDHKNAAALLDEVNTDLLILLRYLRNKYLVYRNEKTGAVVNYCDINDNNKDTLIPMWRPEVEDLVKRLITNYNFEELIENRPGGKDTSYTLDKGRKIYMCLRDPKSGILHDKNTVLFVILHECSHVANASWGHSQHDFWVIFKFLLHEATKLGVYRPIDYGTHNVMFCGLNITYNPLYDEGLPSLWN